MHILGAGSIGSYFAATSSTVPTLILRNKNKLLHFEQLDRTLRIVGKTTCTRQVDAIDAAGCGPINQLLVTTKAGSTVDAVRPLVPKLCAASSVIVLQNGIGIDAPLRALFTAMPHIYYGVTSIGVSPVKTSYTFEHTGGTLNALISSEHGPKLDIDGFTWVEWPEFQQLRLRKLLVNAVINPLTAITRSKNGKLLEPQFRRLVEGIVNESCEIVGAPRVEVLDQVLSVAESTAANTSSMLNDVEQGRPTEIEYINGYLVGVAAERGKSAKRNKLLVELVQGLGQEDGVPLKRSRLFEQC